MNTLKLTDLIEKYNGSSDIEEWLDRFLLVMKLRNVSIKDYADFMALMLEGPALNVYRQLADSKKSKYEDIMVALRRAFGLTKFEAYEKFINRKLHSGEAPDTFMASLNGYLRGMNMEEEDSVQLLICQFVKGLPDSVSPLVKAFVADMETTQQVVDCAKSVLANQKETHSVLGAAVVNRDNYSVGKKNVDNTKSFSMENVTCFSCGKKGHMQRECGNRKFERKSLFCYRCEKSGHIARFCRAKSPVFGSIGKVRDEVKESELLELSENERGEASRM